MMPELPGEIFQGLVYTVTSTSIAIATMIVYLRRNGRGSGRVQEGASTERLRDVISRLEQVEWGLAEVGREVTGLAVSIGRIEGTLGLDR